MSFDSPGTREKAPRICGSMAYRSSRPQCSIPDPHGVAHAARQTPDNSHDLGTEREQARARAVLRTGDAVKKEYDFSKGRRNPYAKLLKRQVTIRLDQSTIAYFKKLAEDSEIPYQTLINLYLRDCASSRRRLAMNWTAQRGRVGA